METGHDHVALPDLAAIEELRAGGHAPGASLFTAFAVLRHVRRGQTRQGKPFFELRLSDRTRTIAGKVWSDWPRPMQAASELSAGTHVKVLFDVGEYKGAIQLDVRGLRAVQADEPGYDPSALVDEGHALVADLRCDVLVFDIETVPAVDLRKVPPTIAQAVAKHAERNEWDHGKVMSLSPYFGQVVSLAVGDGEQDPRTMEVTVFVVPPPQADTSKLPAWIRPVGEADLLRAFWALAGDASVVVSYNGRFFDLPFLVARSLIHGVPVRTDLLSNPFALRPHLDLHQVLHSGGRDRGPASLDVVCWALGLQSPKADMDGSMVATTYATGDLAQIALYNAGDVRATTGIFQRVREGLLRWREDW